MRRPQCTRVFVQSAFCLSNSLFSFSQVPLIDSLINKEQIRASIEFLASDALRGRLTGSPEILKAANFIAEEFRRAGTKTLDSSGEYLAPFYKRPNPLLPFYDTTHPFGYNIIGILPGSEKPSELIIFSAHYDHIGTNALDSFLMRSRRSLDYEGDIIYNGANDNASGTAALISLSRYFGTIRNNKRTLVFVAFSGEEYGLVGSSFLAASLVDPASIICQINLEMLGRGTSPFITGSQFGDLRKLLNQELARIDIKRFRKHYFKGDGYSEQNLFKRSDNYPLAKLGIPAHTIMVSSGEDSYYHTVEDEPSTLNYGLVERVTQAIALAVMPIVNGDVTPNRIDAKKYSTATDRF